MTPPPGFTSVQRLRHRLAGLNVENRDPSLVMDEKIFVAFGEKSFVQHNLEPTVFGLKM